MTALTALDAMPIDTVITVDARSVGVEGSSIYLTEGESLTLEQLLYALLLESANDAATAIAVGVSGSVEAFADLMNEKAAEIGLTETQFQNPHGLDAEGHYTTARELAKITAVALRNPCFSAMVSTRKTTIPHDGTEGVRLLVNHNKLLREYDGAIGVKTGFTKKSGRCLVSAAQRNGAKLVAVTLHAPDDWRDQSAMLDDGFSQMESVELCDAHQICMPISVVGGDSNAVFISNAQGLSVAIPKNHSEIKKTVEAPRFLYASVDAGESVGKVVYKCDLDGDGKAETIGEVPLTAQSSVARTQVKKGFWKWLKSLFGR
jgi:D-alanyl-D-alanine carboxypeptidase/D-alanyl-D-alanine carboxypeptidase (penicillin-binding protein 5/6)